MLQVRRSLAELSVQLTPRGVLSAALESAGAKTSINAVNIDDKCLNLIDCKLLLARMAPARVLALIIIKPGEFLQCSRMVDASVNYSLKPRSASRPGARIF